LADLLSALHQGQAGFADARSALAAAADALRWDRSWTDWLAAFARLKLPPRAIKRVAFAARAVQRSPIESPVEERICSGESGSHIDPD
jgi:hypothetical protein